MCESQLRQVDNCAGTEFTFALQCVNRHWLVHCDMYCSDGKILSTVSRQGLAEGEVPVGAVLVDGQELVCSAHNQTEVLSDPTAHAEMLCIREGARRLGMR
eukprot:evm.model.scf_131.13 EVM.evm.TU.scf_131.13   scf_131:93056-93358(-)